jgi:hypothetical protein
VIVILAVLAAMVVATTLGWIVAPDDHAARREREREHEIRHLGL